eukprot:2405777-Rhodomonas_salina.1
MREISAAARDTQTTILNLLTGTKQLKQIAEKPSDVEADDLDCSLDSQFKLLPSDDEEEQAPLVGEDFLDKERWDHAKRGDLASGPFVGLDECRTELVTALAKHSHSVLIPFPVRQGNHLPGTWLPFE